MDTTTWSPKKILVGIDFSPQSEAALAQALWLAERTGAAIAVAHVLSDVRKAMLDMPTDARWQLVAGDVDAFERSLRSKSDAKLDALIDKIQKLGVKLYIVGPSSPGLSTRTEMFVFFAPLCSALDAATASWSDLASWPIACVPEPLAA